MKPNKLPPLELLLSDDQDDDAAQKYLLSCEALKSFNSDLIGVEEYFDTIHDYGVNLDDYLRKSWEWLYDTPSL